MGSSRATHILILTNPDQEKAVRALVPGLPAENIVAEPAKRDTAAAIALGAGVDRAARRHGHDDRAARRSPHQGPPAFQRTLRTAVAAAEQTGETRDHRHQAHLGVPRLRLHRAGANSLADPRCRVRRSLRWPAFAKSRTPHSRRAFSAGPLPLERRHVHLAARRHPRARSTATRRSSAEFIDAHSRRRRISPPRSPKDFPTCRKSPSITPSWKRPSRVLVVEAGFDWDDVGGWTAVAKYLARDAHGNHGNTAS